MAARWDKGGKDYINCPLDKEQYEAFVQALRDGEKTEFKEWEKDTPYFEGCMPIEVMAERGVETLRFGPMKGVGLDNPRTGPLALCRRPAPPGQCARHLVEHGRLPDQAEARRAGAHLPHYSRASRMPSSRGLAESTATASSTRPSLLDRELRLKSKPNIRFRRPDHRLRGLCRKRRDRPDRARASRPPSTRAKRSPRLRRKPRSERSWVTSPAAPTRRAFSR